MKNIPFIKMHGLGNDFVIIDCRNKKINLTPNLVKNIANRHTGIGCDQIVTLHISHKADCLVRFYNPDGSESGACGNASRCIAHIIMNETNRKTAIIETISNLLECSQQHHAQISIDMGAPLTNWQDIPLSHAMDTHTLDIKLEDLTNPFAVNMGNPHAVFFVQDVKKINLDKLAPKLEQHPFFPERANIGIAQIISDHEINLRVWERGTSETLACGSGACAAVVAAHTRKLTTNTVEVTLPGGQLNIRIRNDNHVIMTGPVAEIFTGIYLPK